MKKFIQKFSDIIDGILTGFDRIVFKGSVLPVMHECGAESFCAFNNILNKDFKAWMLSRTADIVAEADRLCMAHCGEGVTHINSSRLRKESLAHERQTLKGVKSGLIGVWSAVESCVTFKAIYDKAAGRPRLARRWGKCKHLYFYYDHDKYGFMSIRLQTWFPYHVQIAMNGREWLRRSLESAGIEHTVRGNKFFDVKDFNQAQAFLDAQRNTHWHKRGDCADEPKKLRPLRKSVADVPLTAAKAAEVNDRFMNQLAQCEDQTPAAETFSKVCEAKQKSGRRIISLDLTGKDRALLQAIGASKFSLGGITNRAMRDILATLQSMRERVKNRWQPKSAAIFGCYVITDL